MNIAIDIRCLMDSQKSGVGEYTFRLLENIFLLDKKNNYFLFYNSAKNVKENLPKWQQKNVIFCEFRYPNKILNTSLKFFDRPKIDKMIEKKFNVRLDLFFIPNMSFIALSKKIKKIITMHDLSFERYPEFYSLKRQLWHKMINPENLCKKSNRVIAVSQNTARDLISIYRISSNKVKVIYSGIENCRIKNFVDTDQENLESCNTKHDKFSKEQQDELKIKEIKSKYRLQHNFILVLCTLEPRKNIEGIIEAFSIVREMIKTRKWQKAEDGVVRVVDPGDIRLIIAGGSGWCDKGIYKSAYHSRYKHKIKFINYVAPEDKFYLYKLAKVFVFPSFYEGFGFPPLEAMACGTPVVAGLNSSLGEVVGKAGLLVDSYNVREMAEAVYQCLVDKELKEHLVEEGFRRVKEFKWENSAKEMIKIFNSI